MKKTVILDHPSFIRGGPNFGSNKKSSERSNRNLTPRTFTVNQLSLLALHSMQVLVVRQDLKMGGGKIAAQCSREIIFSFILVSFESSSHGDEATPQQSKGVTKCGSQVYVKVDGVHERYLTRSLYPEI